MSPRIAVITPYCREPIEVLRQCHESVVGQAEVVVDHLMVADGHPLDEVGRWNLRHAILPRAHGDNGNTPRAVGSLLADAEGYDFIAYLDADNWYHPGHLRSLVALWRSTGAPVCCSFRTLHRFDGSPLDTTDAEEDGLTHVDTSCLLLHRKAFRVCSAWARMPRPLAPICDRVMLAAVLHERLAAASTRQRSVAFRSQYESHYTAAGEAAPEGSKPLSVVKPAWDYLRSPAGVSECVERLGFWPPTYFGRPLDG
jgi:hypothetical protein